MASRNIHLDLLRKRQNSAPVLQKRDRFQLGEVAFFRKFSAAYHLAGMFHIQIWIFEQTGTEHIQKQPGCGPFKTAAHGLFPVLFASQPVSLQHRAGIVVSAELIHAGLQGL